VIDVVVARGNAQYNIIMSITRNFDIFPSNANGDVLWRMRNGGDDLSKPREIDFSMIFPSKQAAFDFAVAMLQREQKVSMSPYSGNDLFPWQATVHVVLLPSHKEISGFEDFLLREASSFGGRTDGWGCFQVS
jgi:hypothetical protein